MIPDQSNRPIHVLPHRSVEPELLAAGVMAEEQAVTVPATPIPKRERPPRTA